MIDGSTDDTSLFLKTFANDNFKVIEQKNQGRAAARNRGVQEAQGSFLFFVDDDMVLESACLTKHYLHHQNNPNTTLVGKVSLDRQRLKHDFDYYIFHLIEKWELDYPAKTLLEASNLKFTTQHLSIPIAIFHSIGGFDNRLTDGEDYDLGMRLLEANKPIFYDPNIFAWHNDFPSCAKYIKRQIEYKRSHKTLALLGKSYKNGVFQPMKQPSGFLKKSMVKVLSHTFWEKFIDKEWFLFLPKRSRYKLYASVVYSRTISNIETN